VRVLRALGFRASLLGVVGALVGWAGTATPSYEGDEAASIMSAERTLPNLFAMAGNVDAVHTAYYVFLHFWIRVAGTTELATRAPSAVAVGILVAGVVVLADRLGGARLGIVAGVLAIVLPRVTHMAAEARSYAFAAAAVAWIGVLIAHLLTARDPGRRLWWRWIALGVAIAAVSWVFLYCVLLVAVVGVAMLVLRRDLWARWLGMALTAAALTSPLALIAYGQRGQLSPLLLRTAVTPESVLVTPWFMALWPAVVGGALALAGVVLTLVRGVDRTALVLALAGAVVPVALLLLAGLVTPLYSSRYPAFCVAFVALLMALGVVRIAELVPAPRLRVATGVAVVAVAVGVAAPVYVAQRGPYGEVGAPDFRQAAEQVGRLAHPGDAVIFGVERPPISPRIALRLYPQHFTGLRDVQLDTPFFDRTHLWDTVKPLRDVVPELGPRVIAVERVTGSDIPPDIALLTGLGYRVDTVRPVHHDTVYVLTRPASEPAAAVR
jgi:mannosyltransferase